MTYFVPVERIKLPAADPHRWMILPVEASNPQTAYERAIETAQALLGLKRNFTVWAAVRDIPSFEHLTELRDCYDNAFGRGKRVRVDHVESDRPYSRGARVAGYA